MTAVSKAASKSSRRDKGTGERGNEIPRFLFLEDSQSRRGAALNEDLGIAPRSSPRATLEMRLFGEHNCMGGLWHHVAALTPEQARWRPAPGRRVTRGLTYYGPPSSH